MSVGQNKTYLLKGVSEIPNIVRMINEGSPELPPIDKKQFKVRSIRKLPDGKDIMYIVPINEFGNVIKGSGAEFTYNRVDLTAFNNTTLTGNKDKPIKDSPVVNLASKIELGFNDLSWFCDRLGIPTESIEAKVVAVYQDFVYEIKLQAKSYLRSEYDGGSLVVKNHVNFFIWDKEARRSGIHVQPVTEEMLSDYDGAFYIAPPETRKEFKDIPNEFEFIIAHPKLTVDYEIPLEDPAIFEIALPALKNPYPIKTIEEFTIEGAQPVYDQTNTKGLFTEPFPHPKPKSEE